MSASSKKKLRNESVKMTDRQLAEQKEAKNVKLYTIAFVVVLAALIVVAAYSGIIHSIKAGGLHERKTVAATVGGHDISNAELSYYYMDSINNFNSTYGQYAFVYGLDTSKPLDQQLYNAETGETWADYFIEQAVASAQTVYALCDAAEADGFTLPQEQQDQLDANSASMDGYASLYGYGDADAFVKAQYGNGTSRESYLKYFERNLLASAYQAHHQDSLTYTDEQLRTTDAQNPASYSSFSYNQYYLTVNKFLTGGTTDENGTVTYTDEERAAAVAAAEEAVAALTAETVTTVEELDAAIAALPVNEGAAASSTAYTDQRYSSVNSYLTEWVTDASREAGDLTSIPVTNTSTDENGNTVENVTAYYVVRFNGMNPNKMNLVNVRHILLSFTGEKAEDGSYTEETKTAAKSAAEEILAEWTAGDATEESFAALANERSTDTGSNTNGGLYENVFPGQMVANFNAWCFDEGRKAGDTGIVETEYGYHIMYFVGAAQQNYRDFLITSELTASDMQTWLTGLLEACPVTNGNTQYMRTDLVLAR